MTLNEIADEIAAMRLRLDDHVYFGDEVECLAERLCDVSFELSCRLSLAYHGNRGDRAAMVQKFYLVSLHVRRLAGEIGKGTSE